RQGLQELHVRLYAGLGETRSSVAAPHRTRAQQTYLEKNASKLNLKSRHDKNSDHHRGIPALCRSGGPWQLSSLGSFFPSRATVHVVKAQPLLGRQTLLLRLGVSRPDFPAHNGTPRKLETRPPRGVAHEPGNFPR